MPILDWIWVNTDYFCTHALRCIAELFRNPLGAHKGLGVCVLLWRTVPVVIVLHLELFSPHFFDKAGISIMLLWTWLHKLLLCQGTIQRTHPDYTGMNMDHLRFYRTNGLTRVHLYLCIREQWHSIKKNNFRVSTLYWAVCMWLDGIKPKYGSKWVPSFAHVKVSPVHLRNLVLKSQNVKKKKIIGVKNTFI